MKKLISTIAAITLFISCVSCSAKGENSSISESVNETSIAEVSQTMYKEEPVKMPDDYGSFEHFEYIGELGKYFVIYRDLSGNIKLDILDAEFGSENIITLNDGIDGASYLYDISSDGSIAQLRVICDYQWGDTYDEKDYLENAEFTFVLALYDASGKLISETTIADMPEYFDKSSSYPTRLVKISESEYAVDISTALIKFDREGNITETIENDGIYSFIGADSESSLLSADYSSISFYGNTFDSPEIVELPNDLKCTGAIRKGTNGYRAFVKMNDGFYGMTPKNEFIKIVDLATSNIISSEVMDICIGSEGHLIMYSVPQNGLPYISELTVRPDNYTENKETVSVAAFDDIQQGTRQLFTAFNKWNDDYKIEEKIYRSVDDFQLDAISGNSPDVIIYRESSMMYRYANKGLLLDLGDITDSDGEKISSIMCENLLSAFDIGGKLYGTCTTYNVPLIAADSKILGAEYTDWSYEQMCDLVNNIPEGMYFANITNDRLFSEFAALDPFEWVDFDKGICDIETESFVNFLEFCKNAELPPAVENKMNSIADKTALVDIGIAGSMQDIENYLNPYNMTFDDVTLVGFPSKEGRRYITPDHIYSIVENGKCVAGAKEFIGYIMSRENQENSNDIHYGRFVSRKDSAEKIVNVYTANSEKNDDFRRKLADSVSSYIKNCDTLTRHDSFVAFIMQEEFGTFLNDEITAEECARRIQDRVSIYLSEQA